MTMVVAVCLGFCGVVLFTRLLLNGNVGGVTYAALVGGVLLLAYVISRGEAVTEFDMKALKVTLKQVEQAKSDVFAKAEAVQRLAEQTARFVAWNVSTAGRFVGDDHPRQMVKQREEIVQMLQQVGTPKDRIEEIVTPINDMVERDLRSDAWQLIWHQVAELNKTREEGKRLDPEPFRQVIIERYDRAELTRLLKAHGVQVSGLDTQLDAVDNFRRTKQLA